jgi:glycosyltransferase involved in cell wall biosynthesis
MLKKQSERNFEIIIVDNESKDNTLRIAKSFGVKKIYKIKKYFPGKSLNIGCKNAKGQFLVFLSSHCIPDGENWLENLLINFKNKKIAAVYGKQSPLKFSSAKDIRDLYITFGNEKKIQKKDYFFHNANSAIKKEAWSEIQFDENLTNIEDRDWAKKIIQKKYWIVYEPKANVFHYHGIHHDSNPERLKSTINVINKIENDKLSNLLPSSLKPENINLQIIIHFSKYKKKEIQNKMFIKLIKSINNFTDHPNVIFIKPKNFPKSLVPKNYNFINVNKKKFELSKILKKCIKKSVEKNFYSDFVLYLNADYIFRPKNFLKNI